MSWGLREKCTLYQFRDRLRRFVVVNLSFFCPDLQKTHKTRLSTLEPKLLTEEVNDDTLGVEDLGNSTDDSDRRG